MHTLSKHTKTTSVTKTTRCLPPYTGRKAHPISSGPFRRTTIGAPYGDIGLIDLDAGRAHNLMHHKRDTCSDAYRERGRGRSGASVSAMISMALNPAILLISRSVRFWIFSILTPISSPGFPSGQAEPQLPLRAPHMSRAPYSWPNRVNRPTLISRFLLHHLPCSVPGDVQRNGTTDHSAVRIPSSAHDRPSRRLITVHMHLRFLRAP